MTVTRSTPVAASCQVREPAAVNDVDWSALREAEFPVGRRYAYFDHAAVAPLPRRAVEAMTTWANDLSERGDAQWLSWYDRLADYRRGLANLIAADPGEIAFIPNTTHGVGLIAEGFPWQPGDRIVLPEDEYPSNVYPWMNLASRGVGLDRVPTRAGRILLDDLAAAIGPQTRLLAISHVEFATGFRNDLDAVGQLCQQRGVALFVDAIQGLGPLRIDVSRTPIDFLAADGHKWLLGPEGAGFLYVRTCWIQRLRPIMVGWHSVTRAFDHGTIDFTLKTTAQRWEGGTFNMPGLHALGASVSLFHEVGPDRIAGRILERARAVATLARDLGLEVFGGFGPSEDSGIVSIVIPEALGGPAQAAARLKERDVILSARGGRLRVSPHCYTNDEDLQRLHDGLSALCRG
ncbi:aminotransferase class V-fold PLP-dependent enzyme [Isosphaera pallida]|uniref:aminotransferase class V-fold PLP-dependent enzyme n=1 Tax=Isosphaera pallida TaxID=128 RepID=UPI001FCCAE35|nr:aminotransferase class V-fold PLP-dependent enzyme [Isosphaera pallida]